MIEGLSPTEARRKAREMLTEVAKGNDPAQSRRRPRGPTLRSFLENDYGPWVTVNRKGGQLTLGRIRSAFSFLLEKKLGEITPRVIEKWCAQRVKAGVKASTCNRDTAALRSALSKAVEWGMLEDHPLSKY